MAKRTLLDMTQEILSAMDSDEVNSINDTTEAQQVALTVRRAYEDIVATANLPEMFTMFELTPSGDTEKPVLMSLPENIKEIAWVKYDKQEYGDTVANYDRVAYMPLEDYLEYTVKLAGKENTDSMTVTFGSFGDMEFFYYTDRAPEYYTDFDNEGVSYLIFDGYDSAVNVTLVGNKSLCYGEKSAIFNIEDSFIPQLEDEQFSLLINKAKALAFAELKQTQHATAEKETRRGMIHLQAEKELKLPHFYRVPKYGRK